MQAEVLVIGCGYVGLFWAMRRFLRAHLEISHCKDCLFAAFLCGCWLLGVWMHPYFGFSYLVFALWNHLLLIGLVTALFDGQREKKILAASFTIAAATLGGNFVDSLASIFVLVVKASGACVGYGISKRKGMCSKAHAFSFASFFLGMEIGDSSIKMRRKT